MAGQEPAPTPTDPQPQDPAPTPPAEPTPAPTPDPAPQPPAEPTGGAKGVPDDTQKMQRMISEAVEKALGGLLPADPKPTEPVPTPAPDVDAIRAEHDAQAKSWAIERELLKAGCVDADAAMVHIKADDVKLSGDGKSVSEGLDLEEIKKTYPYLFQESKKTVSTTATPGGSKQNTTPASLREGVEAAFAANQF